MTVPMRVAALGVCVALGILAAWLCWPRGREAVPVPPSARPVAVARPDVPSRDVPAAERPGAAPVAGSGLAGVSGRVTGTDGSPLAGAEISCAPRGAARGRAWVEERTLHSECDGVGRFTVGASWPEVTVWARLPGWCGRGASSAVANPGDRDVELVLEPCGGVRGTVTTAAGTPLEGATVEASPIGSPTTEEERWRSFTRSAETSASGEYSLDSLPPGAVVLIASHPDWCDELRELDVTTGDPQEGVDFQLVAGLSIRGRVVDPQGAPVIDARVAGRPGTRYESRPRQASIRRTRSREDGSYVLAGLDPGPYTVEASHPDCYDPTWGMEREPAIAGEDDYDFVLARGGTLRGIVVGADGEPVGSAQVQAGTQYAGISEPVQLRAPRILPTFSTSTRSGLDGSFERRAVAPGDIGIYADAVGHAPSPVQQLTLEPGATIEGIVLRLREGIPLSGRVVDQAGAGIPGAQVRVTEPNLREAREEATTDAQGSFAVVGLSEGATYLVGVTATGHVDPDPRREVVAGGDPLRIELIAGATVRGTVRVEGGSGDVVAEITLHDPESAAPRGRSARCEPSGAYEVTGLPPGSYRVTCTPAEPADVPTLGATARELELAAGQVVEGFDFLLETGGTVTGVVLGDGGEPIAGGHVSLHLSPEEGSSRRRGASLGQTVTGEDGAFAFAGVPAEGAMISLFPMPGYRYAQAEGAVPRNWFSGEPVARGEHVVIHMTRGQSLRGRVLAPGGEPVTSFQVILRDSPAWAEYSSGMHSVQTGDGRFEVWGISTPPARVDIEANGFAPYHVLVTGFPATGSHDLGDLVLDPGSAIRGRVVGADGSPFPGALVEGVAASLGRRAAVASASGGVVRHGVRQTVADEDGAFTLTGMPAGAGWLVASAPGMRECRLAVDVPAGGERTGVVLTLAPGASVAGRVLGAGRVPVTSEQVTLKMQEDGVWRDRSARTDEQGEFTFEDLPPGTATVSVGIARVLLSANSYRSSTWSRTIEIPPSGEVRCDLEGFDGCLVHGRVQGLPAGVRRDVTLAGGSFTWYGTVADDDTYEVTGVAPGRYVLSFGTLPGQPLQVPDIAELRHDVQLFNGAVTGIVRREDGGDSAGARVRATPLAAAAATAAVGASAGAGGAFQIAGLSPGTWALSAALDDASTPTDLTVEITPGGAPAPVELVLAAGRSLQVRLLDSRGRPLPSVYIAATTLHGGFLARPRTDALGVAAFDSLPAAEVVLAAWTPELGHTFAVLDVAAAGGAAELGFPQSPASLTITASSAGAPADTAVRLLSASGATLCDHGRGYPRTPIEVQHTLDLVLPPGSYVVVTADGAEHPISLRSPGATLDVELP